MRGSGRPEKGFSDLSTAADYTPKQSKLQPLWYVLLRKHNRGLPYESGNRNPFTAAQTYFAMIRNDYRDAEDICDRHAQAKSPVEADYIFRRTARVVSQRRAVSRQLARSLIRNHALAREWPATAVDILAGMILFGFQTGYCCAKQSNIGASIAGVSRETAGGWVRKLRDVGIVRLAGFDWRGEVDWRGRQVSKWCHIYELPDLREARRAARGGKAEGRIEASEESRRPNGLIRDREKVLPNETLLQRWERFKRAYPRYREFRLPEEDPP